MTKEIYLAGGCFWGTQHYLRQIRGVLSTATGYANGHTERPPTKKYTATPPDLPRQYGWFTMMKC